VYREDTTILEKAMPGYYAKSKSRNLYYNGWTFGNLGMKVNYSAAHLVVMSAGEIHQLHKDSHTFVTPDNIFEFRDLEFFELGGDPIRFEDIPKV
jgi:hypothetical protein